jgi:hypothetical protein
MAVGVTDRLWSIGDIVDVLEAWEIEYANARSDRLGSENPKKEGD